ncbi:Mor transcription activator family protein [Citrobacter braakii]|uniref:Mor transcription activator family protein n=1 Tax=Citrobacter braakii TaxID=57706 RepID=UPI004039EC5A
MKDKLANGDLFSDRDELEPVIDNLHHIPAAERGKLWPGVLGDLLAVMRSELTRTGMNDDRAHELAGRLAMAIGVYMGGRNLYLPTGESLKLAVRDMLIYAEFNGRNFKFLLKKYRLTKSTLYDVLKRERAAYIRRRQYPLI